MNVRYWVGKISNKPGYKIVPDYRWPQITADLPALGFALLKKRANNIKIVQIGAFDGKMLDPLARLLMDGSMSAILIEPQKVPFEKFAEKYKNQKKFY